MKTEMLGLKVLEELVVRCGNCGAPLANVVVTETNEARAERNEKPLNTSIKVNGCHKCSNGSSFTTKVLSGTVAICAAKDNFDLDVIDSEIDDENVIRTTLQVRMKK